MLNVVKCKALSDDINSQTENIFETTTVLFTTKQFGLRWKLWALLSATNQSCAL